MSSKRKRVVLSITDTLKILDQLEKDASGCSLAREFGVTTSRISNIKKQSESIKNLISTLDSEQ